MNLLDVEPSRARELIGRLVRESGAERYRTSQVFDWLWKNPIGAWADASNLPRVLREQLDRRSPINRPALVEQQQSRDGTVKYLWRYEAGAVESVLIPEGKRITLCISSQVGCAFGCIFCATGTMKFGRNLEAWEITAQVRELHMLGIRPTNIVFMGMGEPLHNWPAVDLALTQLNSPDGCGIGARHITVSTVGLIPELRKLAARPEQFRLALSLHAADPETRRRLMPVEKKYAMKDLAVALADFRRRVTLEYVMIDGENDSDQDAARLAEFARPIGAHVNLLPLHPGSGIALSPASAERMDSFAKVVQRSGVPVSIRRSRGKDIDAACGQLATKKAG